MTEDTDRGTGRTTRQLKECRLRALFVCGPGEVEYTRRLAEQIGRSDIRVISAACEHDVNRVAGLLYPEVVVDHAAQVSERFLAVLRARARWLK